MKLFSPAQTRAWDAFTIEREPISSVALMDRAAQVFADWVLELYPGGERAVLVFAGPGNNGGDGLAVARLLHAAFFEVTVVICAFDARRSDDFEAQLARLPAHDAVGVQWLDAGSPLPTVPPGALIIDALFGSGLSRPLGDPWAGLIAALNALPNDRLAIDLPSGLFADRPTTGPCIHATRTLSFETPKLAFFFPENTDRVGEWSYRSISLHPDYLRATETPFYYTEPAEIAALVRLRSKFSHKGTFGHALLLGGSYGKIGAVVLAARACLRAGVGLLTVHLPRCGYAVLQTAVPEAMCQTSIAEALIADLPENLERFQSIGVGPGLGLEAKTAEALEELLRQARVPLVLDADALNLLATHPQWWPLVPKGSILTPHPKEFERLFGKTGNSFARLELLRANASAYGVVIVLKGAFTCVAAPDGSCFINSSGNPGLATGGTGDVLTGLLTGLLAQGYGSGEAARLGVYLHGLSADLAVGEKSEAGLIAGDVVDYLGAAWKALKHR